MKNSTPISLALIKDWQVKTERVGKKDSIIKVIVAYQLYNDKYSYYHVGIIHTSIEAIPNHMRGVMKHLVSDIKRHLAEYVGLHPHLLK